MPVERDGILLASLRDSLVAYERAVIASMTASVAFLLLFSCLDSSAIISVRHGELSVPAAWAIALSLFLLLGGYARSAIGRAEESLAALKPTDEVREAIALSPSLATANEF